MWVIYGERMAPGRGNKALYTWLKTIFNMRWWMSKTNNSWVDSETMHFMWGHIFWGGHPHLKTIISTKVDDAPFWGCHPRLFDKTLPMKQKNNPNVQDIDNPWLNYSRLCQLTLPTSLTGELDHVSSCDNPFKVLVIIMCQRFHPCPLIMWQYHLLWPVIYAGICWYFLPPVRWQRKSAGVFFTLSPLCAVTAAQARISHTG